MARVLLVVPMGNRVGVTSALLGLIHASMEHGQKVVFVKPLAQSTAVATPACSRSEKETEAGIGAGAAADQAVDYTVRVVALATGIQAPNPIAYETMARYLAAGEVQELLEEVVALVNPLHHQAEVIIVEGLIHTDDFTFDHEMNIKLAEALDADIILVTKAGERTAQTLADEVSLYRQDMGERIVGCMVNRVPSIQVSEVLSTNAVMPEVATVGVDAEVRASYAAALDHIGIHLLACVPDMPLMAAPRLQDVCDRLGLSALNEEGDMNRRLRSYALADAGTEQAAESLRAGHLLITTSAQPDILLAISFAELVGKKPAGIILTGGQLPSPSLMQFCERALESGLPVLLSQDDSISVVQRLQAESWPIAPDDVERARLTMHVVAEHIDGNCLNDLRKNTRPRRLTPPAFRRKLIDAARHAGKRIVLPEGEEVRTITAAIICANRGIARPVLLGDAERIRKLAHAEGVTLPDTVEIINPLDVLDRYIEPMVAMRQHKGLTPLAAEAALADTVVLGTMMLALDEVDGLVSGAVHTTANTIRPALQLVKTEAKAEGEISLVSSVFFMCLLDQVMVYGDCAVNPDPNTEQLAEIALQSAASAEAFGIPARVAMISYSTGSSGSGADVQKVVEATAIVRQRRPDLLVDGPLQYDAAVTPEVARLKAPDSPVAGRATVIIFPDLNTGNTTYKAVQRSAHVVSIGPMLQGLAKPVNDLSRGALVEDIVYTIALTAIQAQSGEPHVFNGSAEDKLSDGRAVVLRALNADDAESLIDFHTQLSDESVRARYRNYFPLQARQNTVRIQAIVNADQVDEIVIGAFDKTQQRLIAVGRLNVIHSKGETAMIIADAWQGCGVARLLKNILVTAAQQRGLIVLESYFEVHNRSAIELARRMGYRQVSSVDGEVLMVLDL